MIGPRFKSIGAARMAGAHPLPRARSGEMAEIVLRMIATLDGLACEVIGNPVGEILFVRITAGPRTGEMIEIDYSIAAHRFGFRAITLG